MIHTKQRNHLTLILVLILHLDDAAVVLQEKLLDILTASGPLSLSSK